MDFIQNKTVCSYCTMYYQKLDGLRDRSLRHVSKLSNAVETGYTYMYAYIYVPFIRSYASYGYLLFFEKSLLTLV